MSTRTTLTFTQAAPSTSSTKTPTYHDWPAPWPANMQPMVVPPAQPVQIVVVSTRR